MLAPDSSGSSRPLKIGLRVVVLYATYVRHGPDKKHANLRKATSYLVSTSRAQSTAVVPEMLVDRMPRCCFLVPVLTVFLLDLALQCLYWLTDRGEDIATAQYIFMGVYVSLVMLVLSIYRRAGSRAMPLWSILLVCTSRRFVCLVHACLCLTLWGAILKQGPLEHEGPTTLD